MRISSTEADPVVKVGKYEIRINDVDPKNATSMERFALLTYMDDKVRAVTFYVMTHMSLLSDRQITLYRI